MTAQSAQDKARDRHRSRTARLVGYERRSTEQLYSDLPNLQLGRVQVHWVYGRPSALFAARRPR